jgi:26S proteasome regulatory subunit N6
MAIENKNTENLLEEAQAAAEKDPKRAEAIYKDILKEPAIEQADALRLQETALVKLGELYRDQKCVTLCVLYTNL